MIEFFCSPKKKKKTFHLDIGPLNKYHPPLDKHY